MQECTNHLNVLSVWYLQSAGVPGKSGLYWNNLEAVLTGCPGDKGFVSSVDETFVNPNSSESQHSVAGFVVSVCVIPKYFIYLFHIWLSTTFGGLCTVTRINNFSVMKLKSRYDVKEWIINWPLTLYSSIEFLTRVSSSIYDHNVRV